MSTAASFVSSCDTGTLISPPTGPSTAPPSARVQFPFFASNLITLPFGNVNSADEAPSEIVTGIFVAYA